MRIIGGKLGGRTLRVSLSSNTRPTADRVREGVASALESRGAFSDARVLDLFAGSGAYGFEALSRGAATVLAVDNDRRAVSSMKDSARTLGLTDRHRAVSLDLLRDPVAVVQRLADTLHGPFDLVFVDPPYARTDSVVELVSVLRERMLAADAWVVLEHATARIPALPGGLARASSYRYGDSAVVLLSGRGAEEAET